MRAEFIDPGAFRTELALEEAVATPDGAGGFTEDWQEVATVMGRVAPVSAAGVYRADQRMELVTHLVTLRFRADVKGGMRFARNGRHFLVQSAHDPDETGRYLVCRVREGIP